MRKREYTCADPFEYQLEIVGGKEVITQFLGGVPFNVYIDPNGSNAHIVTKPHLVARVSWDSEGKKTTSVGGIHEDKILVWLCSSWPDTVRVSELICDTINEAWERAKKWVTNGDT